MVQVWPYHTERQPSLLSPHETLNNMTFCVQVVHLNIWMPGTFQSTESSFQVGVR